MFHGETTDREGRFSKKEHFDDKNNSYVPYTMQHIFFPYTGPPGTGPGLLGSRPGAGKTEYLIALEHHANSLKSALSIAASLKNKKDKDLDIEVVYDSICDIESQLKSKNDSNSSNH